MRKFSKFLVGTGLVLMLPSIAAQAFDEKAPILCAIRDISECGVDYPCVEVTPGEVALPDFFEIDLAGKQIRSAGAAAPAASPIGRIERLNGKLVLQGGDASGDNPRGGLGWTMMVNEGNGGLVVAGVADGFAMVVFGSCLQK